MIPTLKICALLMVSSASAYTSPGSRYPPVSGHDFDFDVVYPSGLSFSTSNPPTEPLSLTELQNNASLPQITLRNPRNASSNEEVHYVSFVVLNYIRTQQRGNTLFEENVGDICWLRANQTLSENGTLGGGGSNCNNGKSPYNVFTDLGDFKNASLHVWQQTEDVTNFLFLFGRRSMWELPLILGQIWANGTDYFDGTQYYLLGYDFPRATVDFNVRNDTNTTTARDEDTSDGSTGIRPTSSGAVLALCVITALIGI